MLAMKVEQRRDEWLTGMKVNDNFTGSKWKGDGKRLLTLLFCV